jgi:peptidoglycan hydrolase-like protein with peptidoglycan-binding domain
MKKRTLQEELERIHGITYGEGVVKEGLLDFLLGKSKDRGVEKKIDEPGKADLVSNDVQDFYNTVQKSIENGGLKEQSLGSMTYQKEVESMQIGLMLLGFGLPKHGVDGLFGPETAAAVQSFKEKNGTLKESSEDIRTTLDNLGYDEKGNELSSGGEVTDELSSIVNLILKEFKLTNPTVKITITSGNDKYHKRLGYDSKHTKGQAVDLVLNPYNSNTSTAFLQVLNKFKSKNNKFSYIDEYKNPSGASTGGHFHLQFGEGTAVGGQKQNRTTFASPEMLSKMLVLLKQRGVTSKELNQYIDKVITGGGAQFTDLDLTKSEDFEKYSKICQKFIDTRKPNLLNITGTMMATGAKQAFDKYQKFVPAELALAQLATEGGIGNNDPNSRPIKTRNPFNVGNVDSGSNVQYGNVQDSINVYYNLIAKNYLGKGKTANDLANNFVNHSGNRYASGETYEKILNQVASQANKIAQTIA